ncbi:putative toxin-antitoxin system toxin component, PIN family [Propionivibrio sp.]|uniref:putative toxin-antitoxin system toxin component, PIN family n=1 Tax=Propionivibrio sp. TaxID=2212460 RepID=UPI002619C10E|nr:putative toxin-antitoxin system toxin component, PIN family [Propionivibrio sp.]
MRVVLDTNVVASAMLWGGTPRLLLQAAREQRVMLFTSTALLAELTDILGRTKFEKKIAASRLTVDQLVDRYANLITLVRPTLVSGIAPDPDDDVVIGTALAAQAKWIVTGDKPLLSVAIYQGVHIVRVSEAVQLKGFEINHNEGH